MVKVARIVINEQIAVSCMVHNMSAHGSKLALDSVIGVPDAFTLDIFGEPPREAKVIWRRIREVGVTLNEI